jgi:hypothetical protein
VFLKIRLLILRPCNGNSLTKGPGRAWTLHKRHARGVPLEGTTLSEAKMMNSKQPTAKALTPRTPPDMESGLPALPRSSRYRFHEEELDEIGVVHPHRGGVARHDASEREPARSR